MADDVLHTDRLSMRPFTRDDGDALFSLYGDARVMAIRKIGTQTRPQSDAELDGICDHWARRGFGMRAVFDRATDRFVGECGLREVTPGSDDIELSYGFLPAVWGRGYATEAGRSALDHGFSALGLGRIYALARADNHASRNVMAKLGMAFDSEYTASGKNVVRYVALQNR